MDGSNLETLASFGGNHFLFQFGPHGGSLRLPNSCFASWQNFVGKWKKSVSHAHMVVAETRGSYELRLFKNNFMNKIIKFDLHSSSQAYN